MHPDAKNCRASLIFFANRSTAFERSPFVPALLASAECGSRGAFCSFWKPQETHLPHRILRAAKEGGRFPGATENGSRLLPEFSVPRFAASSP